MQSLIYDDPIISPAKYLTVQTLNYESHVRFNQHVGKEHALLNFVLIVLDVATAMV